MFAEKVVLQHQFAEEDTAKVVEKEVEAFCNFSSVISSAEHRRVSLYAVHKNTLSANPKSQHEAFVEKFCNQKRASWVEIKRRRWKSF